MTQLTALYRKNLTLYRRAWCCSILELMVVFGIAVIIYVLRQQKNVVHQPEQSFVDDPEHTMVLGTSQMIAFDLSRCCPQNAGKIALMPPNDALIIRLNDALNNNRY